MKKYNRDSLRKTILPGDIVFVRSESIVGKIIRWTTGSNINHVALYIGNGLVIESTLGSGVIILPIDVYVNDTTCEIYLGRLKEEFDIWGVITYSYNFYGTKYDLIGQLGILLRFLVNKLGLQKTITFFGRNKAEHKGLWCSEFIGLIFKSVNIKFHEIDVTYLSPSDLYNSSIINKIDF